LEAEKLADRAADIGAYLLDGLRGLMRHRANGDVRGRGFLLGVELVKDRTSKDQLVRKLSLPSVDGPLSNPRAAYVSGPLAVRL
jgi:4-aminobutyrate aminotransferase-like enzyme